MDSKIFNIPANQHFFKSLHGWLLENFSNELSEVKILLPNQRSCRQLQQLFLEKTPKNSALILPKIKAISDISYEDFFDFPQEDLQKTIDELLQVKVSLGIDYLFFLSKEIQKLTIFGKNLDPNQALSIAIHIKNLFDEIENEEVDLKKISEIDDSDLSLHRQVTVEFLQNFYFQVKNSFIKENIYFASSYRNLLTDEYVKALKKYGLKSPIIVAGSTGSTAFGKKIIKAVLEQKNGHVVLYGFNQNNKIAEELPQNHPQFLLNSLLKFLEVSALRQAQRDKSEAQHDKLELSSSSRQDFLSLLFLPQENSNLWQEKNNLELSDLSQNIKVISCNNELEEAKIVALILAENYHKKSAVIINNQKFYNFLKLELQRLGLEFNDTINKGVFNCELINFILLVLEFLEGDFASANLLAILKHPLFFHPDKENILLIFEKEILRKDRSSSTILGVQDRLKTFNDQSLQDFFAEFYQNFSAIKKLQNKIAISEYILDLILLVEKLTKKSWQSLLEQEEAQVELFEFFEEIKQDFIINPKNFLNLFKTLLSQVSFFTKTLSFSPIQLLSTIEARLINHDLVIISSLNEGDFPQIEAENWLGKKIRKDLGIDKKLVKIGQNAYDFCNYLSNESVILTHSLTRNNSPASPSPFLLKLITLAKKLEINFDNGQKYHDFLQAQNQVKDNKIKQPNPRPKKDLRPNRLAITDIAKLMDNPYQIYSKRILKLRKIEEIDFEPSYPEFGSFVHKALEEFIKNPQDKNFLKNAENIFEQYFLSKEAKLIWWPKFENIFNNFLRQEQTLQAALNYTEIPVKMVINNILINGKIDRISFDKKNSAAIYDYKTGQIPTKTNVLSGLEPQLTIAALMLIEGAIESEIKNIKIDQLDSINYWKLSATKEERIAVISSDNKEIQILIESAKLGLTKLFDYFFDENNGYICNDTDIKNDYWHLSRVEEWE